MGCIVRGAIALSQPAQVTTHHWWPFVLLLFAGAARWIVTAAHAEAESTLASEAIGCAWAAFLALLFLMRQPSRPRARYMRSPAVAIRHLLAGAMLFGGPAIYLLIRSRELEASSLTIGLALTPVIIAIAAPALGTERTDGVAGRIWPGLAAVAGLLLLLAQPTLGDLRSDLALFLAPTLTGVGAALFGVDVPASPMRITSTLLGASLLFTLALAANYVIAGVRPSISLLAVACDGLLALLGVIALEQLGATRWSSQFTWIPLLIVLEGIVLVRPQLTAYWIAGLVLLAIASVYLLLPQADEPTPAIPSRLG